MNLATRPDELPETSGAPAEGAEPAAEPTAAEAAQRRAITICAEAIGEVMRFWNFKPSMGRIWTVLYLSPEPLDAEQIEAVSGLSAGNVSMTLQELLQWGVVKRVTGHGGRRRLFAAETDILSLVARVFRERELRLVDETILRLEEALALLDAEGRSSAPGEMLRGRFVVTRLQRLLELTRVGRTVVARLAMTGSADLAPIRELLRIKRG